MKRKRMWILLLLFVCMAIAAGAANSPEKRTLRFFDRHREALEEDIAVCMETGQASSTLNLIFNYWDGAHPVVEYIAVSRGLGSASAYYGFFYSFDGEPVSFQNAGEPLTAVSEQEWTWNGDGDDHGLVRRLDVNWFYFEAML